MAKKVKTKSRLKPKLTNKQRAFVTEYMKDFNGTQAMIRAGYSKQSANQQAAKLMAKGCITEEIQKRMQVRENDSIMSAQEVLQSLSVDARARNKDVMEFGPDGKPSGSLDLAKLAEMPVCEITVGQRKGPDGEYRSFIRKVKPSSHLTAIELMGKHHKLWTDKTEIDISDNLISKLNEGRRRAADLAEAAERKALPAGSGE